MSNRPQIGVRGLNTSDNPLNLPPGTLTRADNVHFRNNGTVEPRRGEAATADQSLGTIHELFSASGANVYAHAVNGATGTIARWNGSALSALSGNFHEEAGVGTARMRMKFQEVRDTVFFASHLGVHRFAIPSGTPTLAGVPRAPDLDFVASELTGNPAAGWMPADSQVAARSVFGIKDANGDIRLGAPSGPLIITNPGNQTVAIAGLVRTGGNTVTATFPVAHGYRVGDIYALSGSVDANFPDGNKTVVTVPSPTTLTYTEAGANGASTDAVDITSGAKNVLWRITLPPDITASHFFQLHRGAVSAGAAIPPGDEMFLVFEGAITSGDISAGYIDFTDTTPESVLGLFGSNPLYTNANSGDGALAARLRPPRAKDIVWWDNRMWFVGTVDVGRLFISILGIGSPAGLQNNDTVTIDSTNGAAVTFTAKTSPAAATDFQLYTDGSASQNIERTARALAAKIHSQQPDVRAYYASADDDAPGRILLESELYDDAFAVWASRPSAWTPALTTSSTGAVTADVSRRKNGISYSEGGLPDGVPISNELAAGPAYLEAMRAVPLRDKLVVTTTNGGVWLVSGPFPYRIEPLDPTLRIHQPDTVKAHGGLVYALSTQGVVAISEAGVRLISGPIEEDMHLFKESVDLQWYVTSRAFGVSRETDHEYQVFLPTTALDAPNPTCHQGFIYNSAFSSPGDEKWSRRTGDRTCATEVDLTSIADLLWLGEGGTIRGERGQGAGSNPLSFGDEQLAVTIASASGTTVTLSSAAGVEAGDLLWQSDALYTVVEEVTGNAVRTAITVAFAAGAALILKPVPVSLQFAPDTGGQPGLEKQVRDVILHFKRLNTLQWDEPNNKEPGHVNVTFSTEKHVDEEPPVRIDRGGWGLQAYGTSPWGDPNGPADERVAVPQAFQKARQLRLGLTVNQAGCSWELCGYSLESEVVSERSR